MTALALMQWLWWPSLVNRVKAQLRRLRQPRYVIATAIGLAYWFWYAGGRWLVLDSGHLRDELRGPAELGLTLAGLLAVTLYWILGSDRGALTFTEAEVQFLFPSPLTRRQLLDFKLVRGLVTGFVGSLFTTFFFGRRLGHPLWFTLGSWVALTTLSWHALGSSFLRARLIEQGISRSLGRLLTLLPILSYVGAIVFAISRLELPTPEPNLEYLSRLAVLSEDGLVNALLWPIRASVRLALAPDLLAFAKALPSALAIAAVHYVWVVRSAVRFEEASLEASERRARWLEARRAGRSGARPQGSRRAPFRLGPHGRPELALAWKGLIAGGWANWLKMLGLEVLVALGATAALRLRLFPDITDEAAEVGYTMVASMAAVLVGVMTFLGPSIMRFDLRRDLVNAEALRALPLTGRQLVLGEMAGPAIMLAVQQWVGAAVGAIASADVVPLSGGERAAIAVGAGLLAPAISLVGLTVQNAIAVLFPSWVHLGPGRAMGPEAVGLRMMVLLGNLLAVGVALLPASLVAVLPTLLLYPALGFFAVPVGAALGASVILFEVWLAATALGHAVERSEGDG